MDEKFICNKYLDGFSAIKLAQLYNVVPHKIYYILKRNNILIRSNKENYSLNLINNFSKINTEKEAYLLGFLLADGQIQKNKQSSLILRLDVAEKDIYIIELLQEYLGLKNRIHIYNRESPFQNVARIVIPNDELCFNLSKFNMIPKKTFNLNYPIIPSNLDRHFIRGYSDGDGCFTCHHWKLVGTKEMLENIQQILIHNIGLNRTKLSKRHKHRLNNNFNLEYGGRKNIAKIFHYLYDESEFFLERKKNKAYEISKKYLYS